MPATNQTSPSSFFVFLYQSLFAESRPYFPQRFADLRWAGFLPQMFMRSTELSATTKLSAEHETPPIANVLLAAGNLLSALLIMDLMNIVYHFEFLYKLLGMRKFPFFCQMNCFLEFVFQLFLPFVLICSKIFPLFGQRHFR